MCCAWNTVARKTSRWRDHTPDFCGKIHLVAGKNRKILCILPGDKRLFWRYNIKYESLRKKEVCTIERNIQIERIEDALALFGSYDANIRLIEKELGVTVLARGTELKLSGEPEAVEHASRAIDGLLTLIKRGEQLNEQNILYVLTLVREGAEGALTQLSADSVCITAKGKPIKAKTVGQKAYLDAISQSTVTIGVGPAGTGKTYLAVAMAVRAFRAKEVSRILLTRPAVEAGERLGFLPGDLQSKVDPYLRPLYDALFDILGAETYQRYLERGDIEIAPLAYMRGRTLDDSFIILDEAQNTTPEQMKMFLTRLGFNSRMVVTGDVTQIDLPSGQQSGLKQVMKILKGVEGVSVCTFSPKDVVRHPLVQRIIAAYDKYEQRREADSRPTKPKYTERQVKKHG